MKTRVITGVVLALILALVVWQVYTPLFTFVIAFLSGVAANEIMKCSKIKNKFILIVGNISAVVLPFFFSSSALEPFVSSSDWQVVIEHFSIMIYGILLVIIFLLAMLKGYSHTSFADVAIAFFASFVVPIDFSLFVKLRDFNDFKTQLGVYFIMYALIAALCTDIGAQLCGMAFGKHKMSPNISPKKTVEGGVCGVLFGTLCNAIAMLIYNNVAASPLTKTQAVILLVFAPFISLMSMMGDLSASVLKRNFNVKDFGKIFPGHGGVMDRLDSTLFTLPLTYCVVSAMKLFEVI